jgi:hypothetical protein
MRFFLWKCVAALAGASLIVICSCEKHRVGEFPEAQKEQVDLAKKTGVSPAPHKAAATTETSPTPAEFFPEKKNP